MAGKTAGTIAGTHAAIRLTDLWDVRRLILTEPDSDGFCRSWIMLFPEGQFTHPDYGKLRFTKQRLGEIKQHFDDRVRHIDIALDANHDQDKATGWLEQLQLRGPQLSEAGAPLPPGLWGLVRWTPLGAQYLKEQIYRYFSPEFGPWTDPETGQEFEDVLRGGGLTNRPFLKAMPAIALAERVTGRVAGRAPTTAQTGRPRMAERKAERLAEPQISRKPWGEVDKDCLPDSAFLDPKNRRLPVYDGAGPKDAKGRYTKRGPLNIHGVSAALAAVHGGRTGKPMTGLPAGTEAKLEHWLAAYGSQKSASEASAHSKDQQVPKNKDPKAQGAQDELDETQTLDESETDGAELGEPETDAEELDEGDMPAEEYDESGGSDGADGDAEDEEDGGDDEGEEEQAAPKSKAKAKSGKAGKKMAELRDPRDGEMSLAEMREELARTRYALYERDVDDTLGAWSKGTFKFREGTTRDGKPIVKSGRIALSRSFRQQYREFMLKDGIRLSETGRAGVNRIVEAALSTALVDLTQRGTSYDPDGQKGRKLGEERDQVAEREAVRLAQEEGLIPADVDHATAVKTLQSVEQAKQLDLYSRAYKLAEKR